MSNENNGGWFNGWKKWATITFVAFSILTVITIASGSSDKDVLTSAAVSTTTKAIDTTAAPTTAAAPTTTVPSLTVAQDNAVREAEGYADILHWSRQGLIDQLSSEYGSGFSLELATFAVDYLNLDYFEEAVGEAQDYLAVSSFSCQGLIDQLSSEYGSQFTLEQATYGANQTGLCD